MSYQRLPADVKALEESVLELWETEDTFGLSLKVREGAPEYAFYEGPPTANGRPGVHHIISRAIKDTVARYRTMKGRHVTRIAGWDTHGLPVEIEAEKQLGISGKSQIEELGVAEFNRVCRESLWTYKEDWERLSRRIGYWLDYHHPYITCSPEYIESVWWALEHIDRKGLLYQGHKIVPYCPRCGTGLSSHEVALGYAETSDPSVTVLLPVVGTANRFLVVWTTTPWTVVSNVGVAYGPDLEYVLAVADGREFILTRSRLRAVLGEEAYIERAVGPDELEALRYVRPLDLLPVPPVEVGRLWPADFVSDEDGTGLVHIAPAFGADDFALGQQFNLPVVRPVDDRGRFEPQVAEVGGQFVKDADDRLTELLKESGLLLRSSRVTHSYPYCWRCESPLLYMARDSWYVRTTAVKGRLTSLNAKVEWHPPEIGTGRMGEWLANNVDWALSRDRYWGTPIPIWQCTEDPHHREVIGSFAHLAERAGGLPEDFDPHRPGIDELEWPCRRDCIGRMRRIPEVLDAWFDSGSMPFAQWHFPFEHREEFESHFPADFIAEGVDQTRGWFYSLLALGAILFDDRAYREVIVNDLILDASGQKMSKSRGNVVDPWEAIDRHGADAIRFYLLYTSNPWLPKRWDPAGIEEVNRKLFDTLRNTYRFFALYSDLEGWRHDITGPSLDDELPLMDRWLLSRLDGVVEAVGEALEVYDVTRATRALVAFVVDDLSNWYVRRSRDRFWATGNGRAELLRTAEAFATLHRALRTCALLLAPFAPFLGDWLFRALANGKSAHVTDFPATSGCRDMALEREMEDVRQLAALGRAAREQAGIKVRQPLRMLRAVVPGGRRPSAEALAILADELNVRRVVFLAETGDLIWLRVKPDFGVLGPRFAGRTPAVARAVEALGEEAVRTLRSGGEITVDVAGEGVTLGPGDVRIVEEVPEGFAVSGASGYIAVLDVVIDGELRQEGIARELINRIQQVRRGAGLEVADRIELSISSADDIEAAAALHRQYIAAETLATRVHIGPTVGDAFEHDEDVDVDGARVRIGLRKVER